METALRQTRAGRDAYFAELTKGLRERKHEAEVKAQQVRLDIAKAKRRDDLQTIVAPARGTVQQLTVHSPGTVVGAGQALLTVVPFDQRIRAEVTLENRDVGFVAVGQPVAIKVEAFTFTKYGILHGTVVAVGRDAIPDEKRGAVFPVVIEIDNGIEVEGGRLALTPGMNVTAEIATGKRRLIEFLIAPVHRKLQESFHER